MFKARPVKIDYDNGIYEYEYEMLDYKQYADEGTVLLDETPQIARFG